MYYVYWFVNVKEDEKANYENFLLLSESMSEPNIYILLKEKVKLKGLFGMTKEVDSMALCLDEPNVFMNDVLHQV